MGARVLPSAYFLDHLRREKLRAIRAKSPLSIMVLFIDSKGESDIALRDFKKILTAIESTTRETDILGYLDKYVIGALLPDTGEEGVQELTKKIRRQYNDTDLSISTGTYPDQLFEHIQTQGKGLLDMFPLLLGDVEPLTWSDRVLKRCLDIVGSLVAILLFSPLMLITAVTIKLTSPGPVIFKQIRCGKRGAPFTFYKFRSMCCNADDRIHREYVENLIDGNSDRINRGDAEKPLYKMTSDPRVTWVGNIIRRMSIDELPQLYNVLKGEMSLVGPRPPLAYETDKYQSWHLRRLLDVKPGITGLWQVGGRSETSFEEMVRLDLQYVRNHSVVLDLKILIKTVGVVLQSKGAV